MTEGTLISTEHAGPRVFSVLLLTFLFIAMAQAVETNAGLGHAWQKMVCLLTGGRGIDAKPRSR